MTQKIKACLTLATAPPPTLKEHQTLKGALRYLEQDAPKPCTLGLTEPPEGLLGWLNEHAAKCGTDQEQWVDKVQAYKNTYEAFFSYVLNAGPEFSAEQGNQLAQMQKEVGKVNWTTSTSTVISIRGTQGSSGTNGGGSEAPPQDNGKELQNERRSSGENHKAGKQSKKKGEAPDTVMTDATEQNSGTKTDKSGPNSNN